MADEPKSDGGRAWIVAIAVCLLLPTLYVLSIGPAYRAWNADIVQQDAIDVAYFPVIWLMRRYPSTDAAVNRYIELWLP